MSESAIDDAAGVADGGIDKANKQCLKRIDGAICRNFTRINTVMKFLCKSAFFPHSIVSWIVELSYRDPK